MYSNNNESKNNLIFPDKKSRFIFSIKTGLIFFPFLFFISLPIFPGFINSSGINPFSSFYQILLPENHPDTFKTYMVTVLISFLYFIIVFFSVFLAFKKISHDDIKKILFLLPKKYTLSISPILSLYVLGAIIGLTKGGEASAFGFLFAGFFFFWSAISILPIIYISYVLYFWLKNKKEYSVILFLFSLIGLPILIYTQVLIGGCVMEDIECRVQKAVTENSIKPCQSAGNYSDNCFSQLAFITDNPLYCKYIKNLDTYQTFCYQSIAVKKKDLYVCDKIISEPPSYRGGIENCYSETYVAMAEDKSDYTLCDKAASYKLIDGENMINLSACYANVAKKINDLTICDKLANSKDRNDCRWRFDLDKKN
jgi:hypothetical protein